MIAFSPHPLTQMSPLPSPVASPISPSSSSIGFWVRQEEALTLERQIRIGNGLPSSSSGSTSTTPSSFYWDIQDPTDVDNFPNRDDYATDSQHSSAMLPPSDIPLQWPSRAPSRASSRGTTRPSLSTSSSRATSIAPSDSVSTTGPIRRRRGSIVPGITFWRHTPPSTLILGGLDLRGRLTS